jgi:nicotinamide phosphoribosyltransferase
MKEKNFLKMTDSYKVSHHSIYAPGTEVIYSYLESRGGVFDKTMFFGLQYYLNRISGVQITKEKIDEAELFWSKHFRRKDVFNRSKWEYILNVHGGKLPLKIKAVKEGSVVGKYNVLMTIENTDDKCFWLTNITETLLLKIWYPITVGTQSREIKKIILNHLIKSGNPELIDFKCHDFGYRGVSCEEQAALGAASHLLSFSGTDTVAGIDMLEDNYYATEMCGFSIPATEHAQIISFGRANEIAACKNFLDKYPTGPAACISDTYNIYNCCENIWGGVLKDQVMNRNGTLIIRPDSGDFLGVIPKVLDILWNKFGGTINSKGYKVLDSHISVIQGDGMKLKSIDELYTKIISLGWSADNLTVGSGGGLLVEGLTRDTNKFAIKPSAAKINGEWIDIYKDPITDPNKKSKQGRLKLIKPGGDYGDEYKTVGYDEFPEFNDELECVFYNGDIIKTYDINEVKANSL